MRVTAALSTRDANALSKLLKKEPGLRVRLSLGARPLGMVPSRNVLAEVRGREKPEELVVVGGHLDSWDLGPGAHDRRIRQAEFRDAFFQKSRSAQQRLKQDDLKGGAQHREHYPGQSGAGTDVDEQAALRQQFCHHRAVKQVAVPQPTGLPGADQALV